MKRQLAALVLAGAVIATNTACTPCTHNTNGQSGSNCPAQTATRGPGGARQ